MAVQDLDPVTGLPKRLGQTNTPYNTPMFASTATPGATGPTGTGTSGAGGTGTQTGALSFQDFLNQDPFWKQFNADLSAQGIADEAAARAQTQRALIQFGEVPENLAGQAASWLDPTTRQLAQQNTAGGFSTVARLNKYNADRKRSIRNDLAARGALRSGELGYQLQENQGQYERAQYDAREQLTNALSQIQSAYAAGQRAAQMARAQALGQVTNNYYSQPPPPTASSGSTTQAPYDPNRIGQDAYPGITAGMAPRRLEVPISDRLFQNPF